MNITTIRINYYRICQRKLWWFSNGINMEYTFKTVAVQI
ncbi:MAG: Dna2/Cas4 domain-containing protein [Chitinophagaceae bacterium]